MSDTFLHTEPGVDFIKHTAEAHVVLATLHSILRPEGVLVLSVPTWRMVSSIEWYPAAVERRIVQAPFGYGVEWRNRRGASYVDDHPNFHDGSGETLERRLLWHDERMMSARHVYRDAREPPFESECGVLAGSSDPVVDYADLDSRIIILRR